MIAIVLTFDKYKPFADHMLMCYQELWPENPFTFRIPYQNEEVREFYEKKYGDKVQLVKSPSGIVDTVYKLIEDLDENEWVFWCMDDRYPISLNTAELEKTYQYAKSTSSEEMSCLLFTSSPYCWTSKNLYWRKHRIKAANGQTYMRRKWYRMIWNHQFMRVGFVSDWFSNFPRTLKAAKGMDDILFTLELPERFKLYLTRDNYGVYGESTSRGKIAINTVESFKKKGIAVPEGFEMSELYKIQGRATMKDKMWYALKYEIKRLLGRTNSSRH